MPLFCVGCLEDPLGDKGGQLLVHSGHDLNAAVSHYYVADIHSHMSHKCQYDGYTPNRK